MKNFNFKSATNSKEAAKLGTGRATFLAGGMSLLPAMKLRLAAYTDLIKENISGLGYKAVNIKQLNFKINSLLINKFRFKKSNIRLSYKKN